MIVLSSIKLSAQTWSKIGELSLAPRPAELNRGFGNVVDICGEWAVAGAEWTQTEVMGQGPLYGSVFVYQLQTDGSWLLKQELLGDNQSIFAYFGVSVAINGDYLAIASRGEKALFVFKNINGTWTKTDKIDFGFEFRYCKIEINDNFLVFGTEDFSGYDFNGAYIYKRNGEDWEALQTIKFIPPYNNQAENIISLYMNDLIIVADNWQIHYYKYNGNLFSHEQLIEKPEYAIEFGSSISVYDNYLIVGDVLNSTDEHGDVTYPAAGAAFIFKKTNGTWNFIKKLIAPESLGDRHDDRLGFSVDINNEFAVVGATSPNSVDDREGYVCFFGNRNDEWVYLTSYEAPEGYIQDYYGKSVAIDNDNAIVGGCNTQGTFYQGVCSMFKAKPDLEFTFENEIVANNEFLEFGSRQNRTFTFSIKNKNDALLNLTGNPDLVNLTGDNVFSIVNQPVTNVLKYNESVEFQLEYIPQPEDEYSVNIEIPNNANTNQKFTLIANSYAAPLNGIEMNSFFQAGDYAGIQHSDHLNFTDNFTVEVWFNTYSLSGLQTIVSKAVPSMGGYAINMDENELSFEIWDNSGINFQVSGGQIEDFRWYHAALVFENGVLKGYVNGEKVNETNTSSTVGICTKDFFMGCMDCDVNPLNQFSGMVDELRIWSIAKNDNQIFENYDNELLGNEEGLVVYHNCNILSSGYFADLAGFNHNGNLYNGAFFTNSYSLIVPEILDATGVTNTGFTINWQAAETGNYTDYFLDIATDQAFTQFVAGYEAKTVNGTSHLVENLLPNTPYYYRIRADIEDIWWSVEVGAYSKSANVVTLDCVLPEKPETPSGEILLCENPENQIYTVAEVANAEYYEWLISPSSAGTTTSTTNSAEINFTDDYVGNIEISVKAINDCGESEASEILTVTINSSLEKPETPSGEILLCENPENQTYSVSEIANAESYEWIISPSNAGTTTSVTNSAEINFADDISGNIEISVKAINDCGESEVSENLTVTINICDAIFEQDLENQIIIYPNPSTGQLVIKFGDNSVKRFDLLNSLGQVILSKKVQDNIEQMNVKKSGIYILRFYTDKFIFTKQVIID